MRLSLALALLVALSIGARLWIPVDGLGFESYAHVRQIEHIRQTGSPLTYDPLSYDGRPLVVLPLYHYLVALISVPVGVSAAIALVSGILAGVIVALVCAIALQMTKDWSAAIFASALAACAPSFIVQSRFTPGPLLLASALILGILWCLLREQELTRRIALGLFVALLFTDTVFVALVAGLIIYVFFLKLEDIKHAQRELELVTFMVFLAVWLSLILFRAPLSVHGAGVFAGNVPLVVQTERFASMDVLAAIRLIGGASLLLGILVLYDYLLRRRNKAVYLIGSVGTALFFGVVMGALAYGTALFLASLLLPILASLAWISFAAFLDKTHMAPRRMLIMSVFAIVAIFFALLPLPGAIRAASQESPTAQDVRALEWIKANTAPASIVLAAPREGPVLNVHGAASVADEDFLLVDTIAYDDVRALLTPSLVETEAVRLLNRHNVSYVLLTVRTQQTYGVPGYITDRCFKLLYDDGARVYGTRCQVS